MQDWLGGDPNVHSRRIRHEPWGITVQILTNLQNRAFEIWIHHWNTAVCGPKKMEFFRLSRRRIPPRSDLRLRYHTSAAIATPVSELPNTALPPQHPLPPLHSPHTPPQQPPSHQQPQQRGAQGYELNDRELVGVLACGEKIDLLGAIVDDWAWIEFRETLDEGEATGRARRCCECGGR